MEDTMAIGTYRANNLITKAKRAGVTNEELASWAKRASEAIGRPGHYTAAASSLASLKANAEQDVLNRIADRARSAQGLPAAADVATPAQRSYAVALGADSAMLDRMTKREVSALIDQLKAGRVSQRGGRYDAVAEARATAARYGIDGEIYD